MYSYMGGVFTDAAGLATPMRRNRWCRLELDWGGRARGCADARAQLALEPGRCHACPSMLAW